MKDEELTELNSLWNEKLQDMYNAVKSLSL
jgi:hypothetical protein